ncbi:MAG: FAD-dependent oxidoreductase, partial [Gammaproteobacteria bacterium]|nr:FAD-dependent oxidoreductase [Gammaproteobacteria bacterium]
MQNDTKMKVTADDIVVVGSGIAGLLCAMALAPRRVTLITKTDGLAGGSSWHAKGGIAAAIGPEDSPEDHAQDTLAAGAGLSDPDRALALAKDGVSSLHLLIDEGVPFDRALDGTLALAREAAHKHARVVHAGGDSTGEVLVSSLIRRIRNTPSIQVLENTFAYDLAVSGGQVDGLITINANDGWVFHRSSRVILATGGIGMTWWNTTNPKEATGDGLAIAARAGAKLADLEFMQFHPTALAIKDDGEGASLPLLTEALRGAGALLRDESGSRFMLAEHPAAELAPRDVVARAIHRRISSGEDVFLDLRPVFANGKSAMFPQALDAAKQAGFDPQTELLPVTPAAHYHMGGVQTDQAGRTSIEGLWACGEVATTGIHGANRLASNSLLEGLVYAQRVANDVRYSRAQEKPRVNRIPRTPSFAAEKDEARLETIFDATRT